MPLEKKDWKKYYDIKIKNLKASNSVLFNINKEHNKEVCLRYPHRMQSLQGFIKNLSFHHHLEGHRGCVNCIEFSEDGRYLISGSDDTKIIVWDTTRLRSKNTFHTGHRGNIFTVKFLPKTADHYAVSGAGDSRIELKNLSTAEIVSVCQCHSERVKRIATLPLSSDIYFSASEDGTVRQFDRRERHSCSPQTNNILVDLRHLSDVKLEAKCLAVNPIKTEIIAVGATDAFIRVYDRRKLTLTSTETLSKRTDFSPLPSDCVQYFTPGHLPDKMVLFNNKLFKTLATTYLTYSTNGKDLLANIGGDNVYLFDTMNAQLPKNYCVRPLVYKLEENIDGGSTVPIDSRVFQNPYGRNGNLVFESLGYVFGDGPKEGGYPAGVKELVTAATSLTKPDEHLALGLWNTAINMWPHSAYLYLSRADLYLKRIWDGDMYAALRDSEEAFLLEPSCKKALFKKILCLHYMLKDEEALYAMEEDEVIMARLIAKETLVVGIYDFLHLCKSSRLNKADYTFLKGKQEILSKDEEGYRCLARDYAHTYNGHCNTTTDIKEVTFIGSECEYIAAGSDDGNIFIWDRQTTNLVHVFKADHSIVNCVQFHPTMCMMATSGIESVIKLWTPDKLRSQPILNTSNILMDNQLRMGQDPMEVMMFPVNEMNLGPNIFPLGLQRVHPGSYDDDDDDEMNAGQRGQMDESSCRTS